MQKTLTQLLDDAERERARKEMSADEPGIRRKLREQIYEEMPGEDLQPHADKMELRVHEHEALELVNRLIATLCACAQDIAEQEARNRQGFVCVCFNQSVQ